MNLEKQFNEYHLCCVVNHLTIQTCFVLRDCGEAGGGFRPHAWTGCSLLPRYDRHCLPKKLILLCWHIRSKGHLLDAQLLVGEL